MINYNHPSALFKDWNVFKYNHEADLQTGTMAMFESSPHMNMLIDENFYIIECNKATLDFFGCSEDENIPKSLPKLIRKLFKKQSSDHCNLEMIVNMLQKTMKTGYVDFALKIEYNRINYSFNVIMKRIPYQGTHAIVAYIVDLTELYDVRDDLLERDRLLCANNKAAAILFRSDDDSNKTVWKAMKVIGEAVNIDVIHIYQNTTVDDKMYFSQVNVWQKDCNYQEETILPLINIPYDWVMEKQELTIESFCKEPCNFVVPDLLNRIPSELVQPETKSILTTPLTVNGEFWGFIAYEDFSKDVPFSKAETDILFSSGYMIGMSIIRNGIMESLEKAKQAALDSAQAKSDFLSRMSHEIRTPMNAIIGLSELSKKCDSLEQIKQNIEKIDGSSQQLLGIINDVLDMSKIDSGKMEISLDEFYFDKMLQHVINVTQVKIKEKYQTFHLEYNNPFTRNIISDELRLSQVFINLINNAAKFTPEGGDITLSISEKPIDKSRSIIHVEVIDSGIGISKTQKEKLFHSFEQADSSITRRYGGTGLGLSISKKIISMLDGEIYIESELGKGSSFIFDIEVEWGKPIKEESFNNKKDIRILLVEPDEKNMEYLRKVITGFGAYCECSNTQWEAFRKIEYSVTDSNPYDFIIVAHDLPNVDAVDFLAEYETRGLSDSKFIVISPGDWNKVSREFPQRDNLFHLSKPILPSPLFNMLTRLSNKKAPTVNTNKNNIDWSNKTILIVEDIEINREIVIAMLEDTKVNIETARDGLEAVEMYKVMGDSLDLILMDIQMPSMDGIEATEKIREIEKLSQSINTPIIAMTANAFNEDTKLYLEIGMDAHITKPIDIKTLYSELPKYIS